MRKHLLVIILFGILLLGWQQVGQLVTGSLVEAANTVPDCTPNVVNYDIVYVRAPRYGDNTNTLWPDTVTPLLPNPGADLRLLHPDCTEDVLFPLPAHAGIIDAPLGNGAVVDPNVSFDGEWVVFSYYHERVDVNGQRCAGSGSPLLCLSRANADLYRVNINTGDVVRLTFGEFTPNTGNGADFDCDTQYTNCPLVGVFNVGPAFVATSDVAEPAIVFTSTRNNFLPPKPFNGAERTLQLFIMDWDGNNVRQIGYLNNSQALHPFQLEDGRLAFTSWENMGARDRRQFNLWFIAPDGTRWDSLSGFGENSIGHHFMTQTSDGDIVTVRYYNLNNNGFGDLVRFPVNPAGPDFLPTHEPNTYMPFQRPAQIDLTDWVANPYRLSEDSPAPCTTADPIYPVVACPGGNNTRVGKVTHPAVAPNDDILLVYTRGAANHNGINVGNGFATPFYDGGLYVMPSAIAATGSTDPNDLVEIVNSDLYSEQWPRPVVPYSQLFPTRSQPVVWSDLANDGTLHSELPANTPYALIGASSMTWRDTDPRAGQYGGDPDPFNASHEFLYNWVRQGADAGLYDDDDIYAIRVLGLLPSTDRSYPSNGEGWYNVAEERIRIMGEIPVRNEGFTDPYGNTDTSFLLRVPADVPFTFQTLDRNGMVVNMAQTWHQMRPGELRTDCGGCHAHTKDPLDFATTVAGQAGYVPDDVSLVTQLLQLSEMDGDPTTTTVAEPQVTVEYLRDVRPILETRCADCHEDDVTDGALNLHDDDTDIFCPWTDWPGTFYRLVIDDNSGGCPSYGLGTPAGTPSYFLGPQLTRYIRAFQARESLLIWYAFGERLDGRDNNTRTGDIDYDPASDPIHPNLDTLRGLTWDEKLTLARWVDLGAPLELDSYWGWFEDDLRPTLWVEDVCQGTITEVNLSVYDLESELADGTLSVTFDVTVAGQPAGTNFAAGINPANGAIVTVPLGGSVNLSAENATITVQIADEAGHITTWERTCSPFVPTAIQNSQVSIEPSTLYWPTVLLLMFVLPLIWLRRLQ